MVCYRELSPQQPAITDFRPPNLWPACSGGHTTVLAGADILKVDGTTYSIDFGAEAPDQKIKLAIEPDDHDFHEKTKEQVRPIA